MKRFLAAALALLAPSLAIAQSAPTWPLRYVPSASEWQAAWANKQDYNAPGVFSALTAGDATGAASGSLVMTPFPLTSFPTATAQTVQSLTTSANGGTVTSVKSLSRNNLTISGAPTLNWWAGLDALSYTGTGIGGGSGQHVARYAQTLRRNYSAGGTANNPQLWALVAEMDDFTSQPSASTNATLGFELDLTGGAVDNASNRQMLSGVINRAAGNANSYEAATGYGLSVGTGAYVKKMANWSGSYTTAALDMRYALSWALNTISLNAQTFPVVSSTVSASTTVPVSNIMPFTSDKFGRDVVTCGCGETVYFGDGQSATETGYTITGTGPTPAGTLTLSSPITLASNVTVGNNSRAIWLGTGFQIAFDKNGLTNIYSDGTNLFMQAPNVQVPNSLSVGAAKANRNTKYVFFGSGSNASAINLTTDGLAASSTNIANMVNPSSQSFTAVVNVYDNTTGASASFVGRDSSGAPAVIIRGGTTTMSTLTWTQGPVVGSMVAGTMSGSANTAHGGYNFAYTPYTGNTDSIRVTLSLETTQTN